jgi:hypothetical protein
VGSEADTDALIGALADAERGGASSAALFPLFYKELHRLAESQLRRNAGAGTLGATTLLHEAYLALSARTAPFVDRARFFGYAAPARCAA